MRPDLDDAIESARTIAFDKRPHSRVTIVALLLGVLRELPEDITAAEIRDELESG